jgi:proteic killer suppression protein
VGSSCRDSGTHQLWLTGKSRRFPPNLIRPALRKLLFIDAAGRLEDLRVPPGNRLEALKFDREHGKFRICFEWKDGDALDVEITDYH